MPLYEYCCENGCVEEVFRKIDERNDPITCEKHSLPMVIAISKTMVRKGAGIISIDTPSVDPMGDYEE